MKWADYVITAVKFKTEKRHIEQVKIMEDNGEQLLAEQITSRQEIVSAIGRGVSFVTAYPKDGKWQRGDNVEVVIINNTQFIRTDGDRIEEDNLGELPEF